MKKGIILILLSLMLCGCGSTRTDMTETEINAGADHYGTYEWISPDGVHYWVYSGVYRYGIAPRYDNNGELVIEKE